MTVTAYKIADSAKGHTGIEQVGVFTLFSWIIRATQKAVKGGALQVYDATITATEPLPDNAIIEIEKKWYKVSTPAAGMLGMFRHYLTETVRPANL